MRILLIPHTGLRKIHGDSNYILFLDLATHLVKNGHFCYMILPKFAREHVTRSGGGGGGGGGGGPRFNLIF